MKIPDKAKRAWYLGNIITTLTGAAHGAPPPKMPEFLAEQYGHYNQEVRSKQLRREIRRLTTKTNHPVAALDKRDLKRLRGK